jgi:Lar family restriction alleviation protein
MTTTNTELVELLSCPFCGGEATLRNDHATADRVWVECQHCWVEQSAAVPMAEAVAAWNTRAALNAGVEEG